MSKFLCWIFGHSYHEDAARYYAIYDCQRCGSKNTHEPSWLIRIWWDQKTRWSYLFFRLKHWYRCNECKQRFGKHDEKYDHLPF